MATAPDEKHREPQSTEEPAEGTDPEDEEDASPHLLKEEVNQCPRCGNVYYNGAKCEMCSYRKGDADSGFE